jgi:hypothetical protein
MSAWVSLDSRACCVQRPELLESQQLLHAAPSASNDWMHSAGQPAQSDLQMSCKAAGHSLCLAVNENSVLCMVISMFSVGI